LAFGEIQDVQQRPRSIDVTLVSEWNEGRVRRFQDYLVGEEPLQIRVGNYPLSVTMRTPGHDFELAAGFLFTEGLVQHREEIGSLNYALTEGEQDHGNDVQVELVSGEKLGLDRTQRNFFAASSCGICGKASIESVRRRGIVPPNPSLRVDPELLCRLPDALRASQAIFSHTGGLHAAGLFDARGELLAEREDVGRHNAVDKIVGWALLEGRLPLSEHVLMVSGRGGFEIVQKAAVAGIPVVASVSAPSSLAAQFAREVNVTLVGFLRGRRFVVYAGEERLNLSSVPVAVAPKE
jgi:FdhD protein